MNINTIKTTLSFSDYINEQTKCDNTAWKYKFSNSWNECDYWSGYISFTVIPKVYIFDITHFPKGTKLKFPLPVKSYNPDIFSSYTFNRVERPTVNVKEFIVGDTFTLNQDLNSTEIKFYLTSDVKVPESLSKYKVVFFYNVSTIPISIYSSGSLLRYLNSNMQFSLNTITTATNLRYINSTVKYSITITPIIYNNRYIISNAKFSLSGFTYINPNCKMTFWMRKFDNWEDCNTWS